MINVVIAEDQEIVRESLSRIINTDNDVDVVGGAENGRKVVELCDQLQPDVVLMDIEMPECDGIEATRIIKSKYPSIKIIMLTIFLENEKISKAIENGADGYVLKNGIGSDELIAVIKNTAKGLRVVHQNVYNTLVSKFNSADETGETEKFGLKERELEIIRMIVQGKNTKEIASKVHLSEGRVKNILTDILAKFQLKDRIQLAVFAVKNGLV